jgi:isopenicillin N synthase-like dioxygenase
MEQTIPVVDLAEFASDDPKARQKFVDELGAAFREFGFAAVENHGIDRDLIYETYDRFEAFFDLDEEVKKQYEDASTGRQRGYTSFGVEHAKGNAKPDLKEFFHLGRTLDAEHPLYDRLPKNIWPTEVDGLRDSATRLYDQMEACAVRLLAAMSLHLGQDESFMPTMCRDGNSIIRVIHYPVCDGFDEPGVMRAAEHEDINIMTLLPEATQSGLEILTRDGEWLEVPSLPGQIIVDTGDMTKRITNDVIPATTHRVVNPKGEPTDRYSMPFFVHPHPDYRLEVLETMLGAGEQAKYPPITAMDFLEERLLDIGVG